MRIILLTIIVALAVVGCSSPPEKKIIPRSELEKMPAVEQEASQNR